MKFDMRTCCCRRRRTVKDAPAARSGFSDTEIDCGAMAIRKQAALRREVMGGLAKGLEVNRAFTRERAALTLSEVAVAAKLPAATARRCLHTLEDLGYVMRTGRSFVLRP